MNAPITAAVVHEQGELEREADTLDAIASELQAQAAVMRSAQALPTGTIKGVLVTLNHCQHALGTVTTSTARVLRMARTDVRR